MLSILEFLLYGLSGAFLVAGIFISNREEQERSQRIAELTERVQGNHRSATPLLGVPTAPALPTVVERVVEVPVDRIVEQRIEVAVIPDNPLDNPPLLRLLEDLNRFCGDLERDSEFFEGERREISDHVLARLYETIERIPGVVVIIPTTGEPFDRSRHKLSSGSAKPGATVQSMKSPGVQIAERVLRPAVVTVV